VPLILLLFAGLAQVLQGVAGAGQMNSQQLFERFLPPHVSGVGDPFQTVEAVLGRVTEVGRSLSVVAVPAFIWFSTRLFAGLRTALNSIYDVSIRPSNKHFLLRFLLNKLRDLGMVLMTLAMFLVNTVLTTGLALLQGYAKERGRPVLSTVERLGAEALAFLFLLALFFLLYRFASIRKVRWQGALVAAVFMSIAFEIAKRLYGLYLVGATGYGTAAADASLGAAALFIVWLYYSALVFLLGGVVAETWELRAMQREQRGIA
ncbi:MAG TPA: YihY/virulence factor BrkB family protein, partial [Gemmatimonadales bacterium]|nr:YihY/virulence factor BrkB family protein [Gemmatimonadales bacterium]